MKLFELCLVTFLIVKPSSSQTTWPPLQDATMLYATPSSATRILLYPNDVIKVPVGVKIEIRCRILVRTRMILNWVRSDGSPMPAGSLIRDGVLSIDNVEQSAAGKYSCIGTSQTGQRLATSETTLAVIGPPRIRLDPRRQVVRAGDSTLITCSVSGDEPTAIQWSALGRDFSPRVSAKQGRLHFVGIEASDAGRYLCTASNAVGQANGTAEVIVIGT